MKAVLKFNLPKERTEFELGGELQKNRARNQSTDKCVWLILHQKG